MSWLAASLLILGAGLVAGFVWYERTRPDAKLVALVGTLAAFGALGRIAFAALPNVKPTTDIALIAGFALGGAPGYVVGAVSALASNFFFGQGPWTPWQMFGWGLVGLFGAGLARLYRVRAGSLETARPRIRPGRFGRWSMAAVCFVVGFLYTAFQDFGSWVTYSDHSLGQLIVYVGQGLGFDLVHAAGCFGFAVLFGPLFIRALERYRRRLRIDWHRVPNTKRTAAGTVLPVALLIAVALSVAGTAGADHPSVAQAASTPLGYLQSAQNSDGGFPAASGQPSSPMVSGWAVMALVAAGKSPAAIANGGASAAAYLAATVGQDLGSIGALERTILAVCALGENPRAFAGHNLVSALRSKQSANGSFSDQSNLTAFAVMALRAAGQAVPQQTVSWLLAQQDSDGGFNFATAGASSDVDDTGAVLQALAARPLAGGAGHSGLTASGEWPKVARAVNFIESAQNSDGGFPSQGGEESNAQSTAWGVQGLDAVGVNVGTIHHAGTQSPLDYLRAMITASGQVNYARGQDYTPVWVTAQAVLALEGRPLPLSAPTLPAQSLGGGSAATGSGKSAGGSGASKRSGSSGADRGGASGAAAHRKKRGAGSAKKTSSRVVGKARRAGIPNGRAALYQRRLDRLLTGLGGVLGFAEGLVGGG